MRLLLPSTRRCRCRPLLLLPPPLLPIQLLLVVIFHPNFILGSCRGGSCRGGSCRARIAIGGRGHSNRGLLGEQGLEECWGLEWSPAISHPWVYILQEVIGMTWQSRLRTAEHTTLQPTLDQSGSNTEGQGASGGKGARKEGRQGRTDLEKPTMRFIPRGLYHEVRTMRFTPRDAHHEVHTTRVVSAGNQTP